MSSKTRAGRLAAAASSDGGSAADAAVAASRKLSRAPRSRDPSASSSAETAAVPASAAAGKAGSFTKALATAQDPSLWNCAECGSTSHVWISLADGTAHCEEAGHTAEHFADNRSQPLYIGIEAPHHVKNFATGGIVKLGMLASDDVATVSAIATIRGRLRSMHSLGGEKWSRAKGWAKLRAAVFLFGIPFLTRAAQLERKRRDAQATAVARWQQLELFRAFRTWREKAAAITAAASASSATSAPSTASATASVAPAVGKKRGRAVDDEDTAAAAGVPAALPPLLSAIPDSAEPFFPAPKTAFEMKARRGHTGLRNLGNTCFMNSVVQCLAHVPLFRAWLFSIAAPTQQRVADLLAILSASASAGAAIPGVSAFGGVFDAVPPAGAAAGAASSASAAAAAPPASAAASAGSGGESRLRGGAAGAASTSWLLPSLSAAGSSSATTSSSSSSLLGSSASSAALASGFPPPPPPPRLMRLNSGLADVLDFGPNPRAADEMGAAAAASADAAAAAAKEKEAAAAKEKEKEKEAASTTRSRVTRATREDSTSSPEARLRGRHLTAALHEVVSRLFGFPFMAVYSPDAFLRAVWVALPQFSGFAQNDAEEYARSLINRLDDEHKAATATAAAATAAGAAGTVASTAGAAGAGAMPTAPPPAPPSPLVQMFGGSTCTVVRCSVCGHESTRVEEFVGPLSVEIPSPEELQKLAAASGAAAGGAGSSGAGAGAGAAAGSGTGKAPTRGRSAASAGTVTLDQCLAAAFSDEVLDGDSAYACDVCKRKVRAVLSRRLQTLPPVLIVHAVRTSWRMGSGKVQTSVRPVLDGWDVSRWAALPPAAATAADEAATAGAGAASAAGGKGKPSAAKARRTTSTASAAKGKGKKAAAMAEDDSDDDDSSRPGPGDVKSAGSPSPAPVLYDLYGSVQHMGSSIRQGHFFAYARNDYSDDFICFNDSRVTPVSGEEVASSQGYLFVFQRRVMLPRC